MGSVRIIPTVFSTCCFVFVNAGSDQDFLPRLEGGVLQLTEPFAEPGEPFTWVLETDVGLTIGGQPTVVIDDVNIINPTITFDPEYTNDSITLRLQADNCESSFDRVQINTVLNSIKDITRKNQSYSCYSVDIEYYVGELFNNGAPYNINNSSSFAAFYSNFNLNSDTLLSYREWTGTGWGAWNNLTVPLAIVTAVPTNIQVRAINKYAEQDYIAEKIWRFWNKNNYNLALNSSTSQFTRVNGFTHGGVSYNSPAVFYIRFSIEDIESSSNITSIHSATTIPIGYNPPAIFYALVTVEDIDSFTNVTNTRGFTIDYSGYTNPQFFYAGQSGV